ncbi:N-(5'-phosphoribosyl)anthranilate isomerase [Candidatus Promineifilum breve]|uniref:N-(5'-phosphoribosyl)anthranilate isomerase n=1 Tax=Candidatus Promineifilum breve TaxID=1806508 RepID=A0A160T1R0_9CHLR|nr:phosphoribosylanthranilate isomerase [Candidatus Promineifilum breve]CUS02320.2 N-(5'-phosphoribosyl)anthranilate isomerase [Candidatus Promineifilum breve]
MTAVVKVKICGITRVADGLAALDGGADYLGFILYPPSPRAVTAEDVAAIVDSLHDARPALFARPEPPLLVGVFVNEIAEDMAAVLDGCRLDLAQLSGNEAAHLLTEPTSPLAGRAYKAIRPATLADALTLSNRYAMPDLADRSPHMPQLLLDTPHGHLYGGSGQTGDWALAAELATAMPRLMLAGGLNPDNVAQAVRQAQPYAVDVAGGVEAAPGVKDHDRVRTFISRAKTA